MPEYSEQPTDVLLSTLNARYIHTAFGLRYLLANLAELHDRARLLEFTIHQRPADIVEKLLTHQPRIIALGVYIWNVAETEAVVALLRTISPHTRIILGGPEVSHPPDLPAVAELADHIITGPGEISLRELCLDILAGRKPLQKVIPGKVAPLDQLTSPYPYYSDDDLRQRIIYVEASRGCPFKCEFCLSSLDKTAKPFALNQFLREMETLLQRGARSFKFIDRTFNLKVSTSVRILEFFLARMHDDLYLHFEVIPDNLPEPLRQVLRRFPPGSLQFEIGVQTFDPAIQHLISRRQDNDRTRENLRWLRQNTGAHIHADLIFGLPGDSLENFAASFDELVSLQPQEIQLGILKRLRGAPLNRHTRTYQMCYNPQPPYSVVATRDINFFTLQQMNRFARYWDLIGNSGHFHHSLPLILGDEPFQRFFRLSEAIFHATTATWKISLKRLYELVHTASTQALSLPPDRIEAALIADYQQSPLKGNPSFTNDKSPARHATFTANSRQTKHL
jgi:radical SAM superfamily enzyme YgiQ (UPF0313 family)